jgi:type II secretory pathway pseudopilin PulG
MKLRTLTTVGGCSHGKGRARSAFTFAEVLAAMLFMAIVIPVALRAVQIASGAGVAAQRKSTATRLADLKLNEVMLTGVWSNSAPHGAFDGRYTDYGWNCRTERWLDENMRLVSVEVTYKVRTRNYSVVLFTLGQIK